MPAEEQSSALHRTHAAAGKVNVVKALGLVYAGVHLLQFGACAAAVRRKGRAAECRVITGCCARAGTCIRDSASLVRASHREIVAVDFASV